MTTVTELNFPVDELPGRLREQFEPGERVDLTIVPSPARDRAASHRLSLVDLLTSGPKAFEDEAAIAAHMDELRGPRPAE